MPEKVFLFGLDKAGKTVITNYLTRGVVDTNTVPTQAFVQRMLVLPKLEVVLWDSPGQVMYRKQWYENVAESKVLIFVLDTSDSKRFPEAKREFDDFINGCYNLRAPVIFCFHKIDLPEAKNNLENAEKFFGLAKYHLQKIVSLKTTIKDTKSLNALRDRIQDLAVDRQLEEKRIEDERKQIAGMRKNQKADEIKR
jgi:small GTP-binding protein